MKIPALFIHSDGALKEGGGGVQICTREYFDSLEMAGFTLRPIEVRNDRRIVTRVRRRIFRRPYGYAFIEADVMREVQAALTIPIQYVFLNQSVLRPLAEPLRSSITQDCRIVLLSHGLRSVDYLHDLRLRCPWAFSRATKRDLVILARMLLEENRQGQYFDYVFCLAPFEVGIENWLGSANVIALPRRIKTLPLCWQPVYGRLGYVGTLDHPPNKEGLLLFLSALDRERPKGVHVRVVGEPSKVGEALARRFSLVEYLGGLTDKELRQEASTWNCFIHPIFCYAMGASMKLSIAIGWQIPIVTTTMGCRGYSWREGRMPIADSPKSFARLALQLLEPEKAQEAQYEIRKIRQTSPTTCELAQLIRSNLLSTEVGLSAHTNPGGLLA